MLRSDGINWGFDSRKLSLLHGDSLAETVNGYLRPSNPKLMPSELKIQHCYLHSHETDRKQR